MAPAELQRLQAAGHHGIYGTEFLVQMRLAIRLAQVLPTAKLQRLAIAGNQVEAAQRRHRHPGKHAVNPQVHGLLGAAIWFAYTTLLNQFDGEFTLWQLVTVHFEEYRLTLGMHLGAD